jgi:hypothetical protein
MPVLHKYKDKDDYFALTFISGQVIAYQLTGEGIKRLLGAGIIPGQKFARALLLDLYRSGEAFTGSKPSGLNRTVIDVLQLEFDFTDDPEPESMFPACALCAATDDLHLVEIKNRGHRATILCPSCRLEQSEFIDSSLPLPLVSRGIIRDVVIRDVVSE